jgi:hypothetical protein
MAAAIAVVFIRLEIHADAPAIGKIAARRLADTTGAHLTRSARLVAIAAVFVVRLEIHAGDAAVIGILCRALADAVGTELVTEALKEAGTTVVLI